jgi:hypothetical protein
VKSTTEYRHGDVDTTSAELAHALLASIDTVPACSVDAICSVDRACALHRVVEWEPVCVPAAMRRLMMGGDFIGRLITQEVLHLDPAVMPDEMHVVHGQARTNIENAQLRV